MSDSQDSDKNTGEKKPFLRPGGPNAWILVALLVAISLIFLSNQTRAPKSIDYPFFKQQLEQDNIESVKFEGREGRGKFRKPPMAPQELNPKGELFRPTEDGKPVPLPSQFRVTIPEWASDQERAALSDLLTKTHVLDVCTAQRPIGGVCDLHESAVADPAVRLSLVDVPPHAGPDHGWRLSVGVQQEPGQAV